MRDEKHGAILPTWTERAATTTLDVPRTKLLESALVEFMARSERIHADKNLSAIGKKAEVATFATATLAKLRGDLTDYANSARVQLRKRAEQMDDKHRGDAIEFLRRQEIRSALRDHKDRGAVIERAILDGDTDTLSAIAYAPAILALALPSTIERAHRRLWAVSDPKGFDAFESLEEATELYDATLTAAQQFVNQVADATETQFKEISDARKSAAARDAAVAEYLTRRYAPGKSEALDAMDRYVERKNETARDAAEAEIALREREHAARQVTQDEMDTLKSLTTTGVE
jgi:hypothetical protein